MVIVFFFFFGEAIASTALRLSFDELALSADRVSEVELISAKAQWGPANRRIYTTYRFKVKEDIGGSGAGEIQLVQPGGTVGNLSQKAYGYPTFKKEQRILLFLERKRDGKSRVVALSQGVFSFDSNGTLRQRIEDLKFSGDAGVPYQLNKKAAYERIQALFKGKK
jgi:hypothetical protein